MSKYNAKKTEIDGILFDSKKEANRYIELKWLQTSGLISNLELQIPYELIPKQKTPSGKAVRNAIYIADFRYRDRNGKTVVEDVKGVRTDAYKLKKKLMLFVYGIDIQEV